MSVSAEQLVATAEQLVRGAARDELRSAVARELADSLARSLAERVSTALANGELSVALKRALAEAGARGMREDQAVGVAVAGLLIDNARRAERHLVERAQEWLTLAAEARGRAHERNDLARALSEPEAEPEGNPGPEAPERGPGAESPAEGLDGSVHGPDSGHVAQAPESPAESVSDPEGQGPAEPENESEPAARGGGAPVLLDPLPSPPIGTRPPEVSP
jgi:hypothetical protein